MAGCRFARRLLLGLACAGAAQAQIYGGTDTAGTLVLSNFSGDAATAVVVPAAADTPTLQAEVSALTWKARVPEALAAPIREAAQRHALPEGLIAAVIAVESNFDVRAVSHKGAKGLMQLMPDTARRFGVRDVFAPHENVNAGAAYLHELLRLFGDDLALALAAYNAGEGAVLRAGRRIPDFRETRQYVAKVLAHADAARAPPRR